jgi:hypothetical protein
MTQFFFYGTLMDADVRAKLHLPPDGYKPFKVDYWRRCSLAHRRYPVIRPDTASHVIGLLTPHLSRDDIKFLTYYEGPEYCRIKIVGDVECFVEKVELQISDQPWSFEDWQRNYKANALKETEE